MSNPALTNLMRQLWKPGDKESESQLYAILDGARDERIHAAIQESESEYYCLLRGQRGDELADVAPYVVQMTPESPFSQWLLANAWNQSWGVFAQSSAPPGEVNGHFRSILAVYDERGKPLHFRYYDPRVFRVYLPTCTREELKLFFGPVSRYFVEGEAVDTLMEYSLTKGSGLAVETTRLDIHI